MKTTLLNLLLLTLASCGVDSDKSALNFSVAKPIINPIQVKEADTSIETDQVYLKLKKDLFTASCTRCHNPENAVKKNRTDLTSKKVIIENIDNIIYRMTDAFEVGDKFMPPKGGKVAPELIQELKAWKTDAQFANLQKNLFEASCLQCHGPAQTKHSDLSKKEVVIEKYDQIIYKMTKAFDENNKPMPPKGKGSQVSPALIKQLQSWKDGL